jgi:hypothetical protein
MRILIVTCELGWSSSHPALASSVLARRLTAEGEQVHEVPLPVAKRDGFAGLLALTLVPTEHYGDVLVGMGCAAAVLSHRAKLVIVDESSISEILPSLDGPSAACKVRLGLLLTGLREAVRVAASSPTAARAIGRCLGVQIPVLTTVGQLAKEVRACAPRG